MYTIITGATSGIGKELTYCFAEKGSNLILISRNIKLLEALKSELIDKYQINIVLFKCDLNDLNETKQTFQEINETYQINCLVNNAGIGYFEEIGVIDIENLTKQINVNLQAPIIATNCLLTNLKRNKGSVINICSILSYLPNFNSSVYTASKFALYGFSNSLRLENPDIHVLTVHPITVRTPFFNDPHYFDKVKKVVEAKTVAQKTYKAYLRKKRKCHIPIYSGFINIIYQIFPNTIDYLNRKFFSNK